MDALDAPIDVDVAVSLGGEIPPRSAPSDGGALSRAVRACVSARTAGGAGDGGEDDDVARGELVIDAASLNALGLAEAFFI